MAEKPGTVNARADGACAVSRRSQAGPARPATLAPMMARFDRSRRRWRRAAIAAAAAAGLGGGPPAAAEPDATLDEKGFTLRGEDGLRFELGGRLHVDAGDGGGPRGLDAFPEPVVLRRIRIEPSIAFGDAAVAKLQYEPSSRETAVKDLLVTLRGPLTVTVGHMKEPFSLEALASNNDITFLERALPYAFSTDRNLGIAASGGGEAWTLSAGVFGGNLNDTIDRGGIAGVARATWTPIRREGEVLHLGIAGSWRARDRRGPDLSFASTPESDVFRRSLVDTDAIEGARAVGRLGFEFAYAIGRVRLQAEYMETRVERDGARPLGLRGGYVQASWVLNGRSPDYETTSDVATEVAVFGRVTPDPGQRVSRGGTGVWEVAARLGAIDLDSRDVRGGIETNAALGLNWYPEPFLRVMANYVHAWVRDAAPTGRRAEADIVQARLQVAF